MNSTPPRAALVLADRMRCPESNNLLHCGIAARVSLVRKTGGYVPAVF